MKNDIVSYYQNYKKRLEDHYPKTEAQSMARLLFEKITGHPFHHILANISLDLNEIQVKKLELYLSQLKLQKPIQYILGEAHFFDHVFRVNPDVLIPRPETEELVHWILSTCKNEKKQVLDIGTGSGCIAVSLALNRPQWKVYATDIAESALQTASGNAENLHANVNFIWHDIVNQSLKSICDDRFDIIVSNPPYVRRSESLKMDRNVLENEPEIALFVPDNDALLFYRNIAEKAREIMTPNGCLFVEINEALGSNTVELLENYGFKNIELRKDIHGKDRMLKAIL